MPFRQWSRFFRERAFAERHTKVCKVDIPYLPISPRSNAMKNQWINWFEIPATNLARASTFYETIFGLSLHKMDAGPLQMAIFPSSGASGALVQGPSYVPSEHGPLLYLDASPAIQEVLDRVEPAGGRILQNKKMISEAIGYMGLIIDSEGNRIALMAKA